MEPASDDHVLDVLRAFAGGALVSVGTSITVLCGAARIEGVISNSSAYSEHLGEELSAAFRETSAAAGDEQTREAAESSGGDLRQGSIRRDKRAAPQTAAGDRGTAH